LCMKISNAIIVRNPVNLVSTSIVPYPKNGQVTNFAVVGNLISIHKGQDLLLEVLSQPTWSNRSWHLNIYGSGPDENYLKKLCSFLGLTNRVTFHGHVADIRGIWERNNMLVMPSLMEGMPLAVVEAMLCARPCVVTDVGGHTEWISEGIEGFIAEAATVHSLAWTMNRAWDNKEKWIEMGKNARNRALHQIDINQGQTFLNLIKN
jgi:glycosyltransferase involved in cell wall biosynthesis